MAGNMKTLKTIGIGYLVFTITFHFSANGLGTFQNLDFESANIPPSTPIASFVPISDALPGWNGEFIDTSTSVGEPTAQAVYDGISTGGPGISLIDDNSPGAEPLQGNYSVFLFGGGNNPLYSASISQTGTVPAGTQSLQFDAYVSGAPFAVTLGGQTIDMIPLDTFAHYTLWGDNIPSALAGQSETLSFIEPPATGTQPSMFELDNIVFSPSSIPEPNSLALTGIGGLLFALYRRFTPKGQ
jgi:hypothetical protein